MRSILFILGVIIQVPLGWYFYATESTDSKLETNVVLPKIQKVDGFDMDIVPAAAQFHKYVDFLKTNVWDWWLITHLL